MDPVEPWIDSAATRRLAAQLLSAPQLPVVEDRPDTGFGPGFEGFLVDPSKGRSATPDSGLPAAPPLEPVRVAPATPPPLPDSLRSGRRGNLIERLGRFRDWLTDQSGARGVFVLDRDGKPVLDDPSYSKLHFLARSLAQAYRPDSGNAGNVHVKVGADAYLVVIPVETVFGCLVLGAVLNQPLSAGSVEVVSRALANAARPGDS